MGLSLNLCTTPKTFFGGRHATTLTTFFIAPLAFSLHSTNMIRPLALALFLSTALIHADHLRGNVAIMDEAEQPRDLAAVDPCTLMTEQQWVNLVAFQYTERRCHSKVSRVRGRTIAGWCRTEYHENGTHHGKLLRQCRRHGMEGCWSRRV